jgi:hypothetical protein
VIIGTSVSLVVSEYFRRRLQLLQILAINTGELSLFPFLSNRFGLTT